MKLTNRIASFAALGMIIGVFAGCAGNEARMEAIAERQARKVLDEYQQSFQPETFGFGVPWEKDFSYAQGVKVGNLIFVAGQLSHKQTKDQTWEYDQVTVGENFETQFRQTLENMKAVLAHFGASMDDVVFLQNFFDPDADGKQIGQYGPVVRKLINEYFPHARHAMTNMQITDLFGKDQIVETNAIAVVRPVEK
jgi:enamine deaminase RidA (YjgF/YER057c/UK114 family)